jgi:hypothetical protein
MLCYQNVYSVSKSIECQDEINKISKENLKNFKTLKKTLKTYDGYFKNINADKAIYHDTEHNILYTIDNPDEKYRYKHDGNMIKTIDGTVLQYENINSMIETHILDSAKSLILTIDRYIPIDIYNTNNPIIQDDLGISKYFNFKKIIPNKTINLKNNQKPLNLYGIITYSDGHYIAFYNCDDIWYEYNDMPAIKIKKIGSYDNLLEYNSEFVKTNSKVLIYV